MTVIVRLLLVMALLGGPMAASAAALIVADGRLLGATGVIVGHQVLDVQFGDGSCIQLFDGCDSSSDFVFQNPTAAGRASRALLDQVFVDGPQGPFDSLGAPNLIEGCSDFSVCIAATPWGGGVASGGVLAIGAVNEYALCCGNRGDHYYPRYYSPNYDLVNSGLETWAEWSVVAVVSEPGTFALFGLGLAGLGLSRRRLAA